MALRLRRGTDAERLLVTPVEGELVYTTDTKLIFAGDGSTIGGTLIAGLNSMAADTTPQLGGNLDLNSKNITGIGNINIDGTITAPQFEGNLHADDSTVAFNSATNSLTINGLNIYGDIDLTESTNTLDVFSNHSSTVSSLILNRSKGTKAAPTALIDNDNIFSIKFKGHTGSNYLGGSEITSDVDGTVTSTILPSDLSFKVTNVSGSTLTPLKILANGNILIDPGANETTLHNSNLGLYGAGNARTGIRNLNMNRSRGTILAPTTVLARDNIFQQNFNAYDGYSYIRIGNIRAEVGDTPVSQGVASGRLRFRLPLADGVESTFLDLRGDKGSVPYIRVYGTFENPNHQSVLGDVNIFQNRIWTETSNSDLEIQAAGSGDVVVSNGFRSDGVKIEGNTIKTVDSNAALELSASGTGIVSATNLIAVNYMQLPVYANDAARGSAIASPNAGMIVFNTTGTKFQGYTGSTWVDLN